MPLRAYHQGWDFVTLIVFGSVLDDLVLAPEEPGLPGLRQLELVEAE
jgi:hypothetical protein